MKNKCICCASSKIVELESFSNLPRVSSDSKPFRSGGRIGRCNACGLVQKFVDRKFIDEITEIYGAYDMYDGDTTDQPIFINGKELTRSKILVGELAAKYAFPEYGRLLEIGAGKGAFLEEFSKYFPNWKLNSLEYDDKYIKLLKRNQNFEKNYTNIDDIDEVKFDLIVAIHTIEHLLDPVGYIKKAKKMLKDDGKMFFQVPDVANSPFDIAIADHVSHFNRQSLKQLLTRAGLHAEIQIVIPKEITAYCGGSVDVRSIIGNDFDVVQNLNYLHRIGDLIKNYSKDYELGIYGTTIAANWLSNQDRAISFYVEDDLTKVGKTLHEKMIRATQDLPVGAHVFLPFSNATNNAIIIRLANLVQAKNIKLIPLE